MMSTPRGIRLLASVALAVVAGAAGGAAQETPKPPVMQFSGDGIGLHEAVQLTLRHDPTLKIQLAEVKRQEGALLEQEGAFDYLIFGNVFYEYRQQEMPESRKEIERDKRNRLREGIDRNRGTFEQISTLSNQLQAVRNAPGDAAQLDAISAIDPDMGAQLRILDVLINNQPNANVRNELLGIRRDFIDRSVTQLQSGASELVTEFQNAEQTLQRLGIAPSDEIFERGGFDLRLSKRLRNGLFFTPYLDGQVEGTNFKDKPRSSDFGGKGLDDLYTFHFGLETVIPLGRGRGGSATGAFERAATAEAEAARLAATHQSALSVLRTINTYWDLRAAQGSLEVAQASVGLQERIVELTRASIEVGELPKVDIARVQASEARSRARLREAERGVYEARVNLAIAMGLAVDGPNTLPLAKDVFPTSPAATFGADEVMRLATEASAKRYDVQSAEQLERASQALARGAETDLRPRFDVVTNIFATSLDEGQPGDALDRWVGPSAEVRIEVGQPLFNNIAEGRYAQRRAELQQQQISMQDVRRQAGLGVVRAAQAVQQARARVDHAQAAVDAFRSTFEAEVERFKGADVTLIDTILTEQQQTDARLALVSAQADLARLIAELRFETGTLVRLDKAQPIVEPVNLISVPRAGGQK